MVGYRNANRILVNYRSVERMIKNRFGSDLRCELVPYTVEKEFEPAQQIASNARLARCNASRPLRRPPPTA